MSLYNMLFGRNPASALLLAVVGLRDCDIERMRNVFVSDNGKVIEVYTRTGGGNRDDYPQEGMRSLPGWLYSSDDDYDSTYCTDGIEIPEEWRQDVANLSDPLAHGIRPEFARHLALTLRREPTEADKAQEAYQAEASSLSRTRHMMANGHTFVPLDDAAMELALELAEANDGQLRSCWGIAPLTVYAKRSHNPYPNAMDESLRARVDRLRIDYHWSIDKHYWQHCLDRWGEAYPKAMEKIAKTVERYIDKAPPAEAAA